MGFLGDEAQVEALFVPFGDSATQDMCTIYTECTLGRK
jgi:hypothetical protein